VLLEEKQKEGHSMGWNGEEIRARNEKRKAQLKAQAREHEAPPTLPAPEPGGVTLTEEERQRIYEEEKAKRLNGGSRQRVAQEEGAPSSSVDHEPTLIRILRQIFLWLVYECGLWQEPSSVGRRYSWRPTMFSASYTQSRAEAMKSPSSNMSMSRKIMVTLFVGMILLLCYSVLRKVLLVIPSMP